MKLKSGIILLLCGLLIGCSSSSSDDDSSYTTEELTIAGTISITEATSSISKSGGLGLNETVTDRLLVLQNHGTNKVEFAEIDNTSGEYSITVEVTDDLDLGRDFIISLIQSDPLLFLGIIYESNPSSDSSAYSGFTFSDEVSNLNMNFDENDYSGIISNIEDLAASVSSNRDMETRISSDKPVGAGNAGRGTNSRTTETHEDDNPLDEDEDGVPNIFDAMNDGQNLDNAVGEAIDEGVGLDQALQSLILFTNLKVDNSMTNDADLVTENALIVVEALPNSGYTITSVEVDLMHDSFDLGTAEGNVSPSLLDLPDGYTYTGSGTAPVDEVDTWADHDYELFEMENQSGTTVYTSVFKPNSNTYESGHLMRVKVTLDDGDIEYYLVSFNFKFTSAPEFDVDSSDIDGGSGTIDIPYEIASTGDIDLAWGHPNDEDGADLEDLEYTFEIRYYDDNGDELIDAEVVDIGTDATTGTLESEYIDASTTTPSYLQIDITARYDYGDNAANKIYIKRSDW